MLEIGRTHRSRFSGGSLLALHGRAHVDDLVDVLLQHTVELSRVNSKLLHGLERQRLQVFEPLAAAHRDAYEKMGKKEHGRVSMWRNKPN